MGFSRQESWGGLPFSSPGNLPNPGIEHVSPASPALAGGFFTTDPYKDANAATLPLSWLCFFSQPGSSRELKGSVQQLQVSMLPI